MGTAGFIHLFFEAHFVSNHKTLAADQSLWSQLWKEYSLSDSRYLTSDTFLLCMEAVTAVSKGTAGNHTPLTPRFSLLGARWPSSLPIASSFNTPPDTLCNS